MPPAASISFPTRQANIYGLPCACPSLLGHKRLLSFPRTNRRSSQHAGHRRPLISPSRPFEARSVLWLAQSCHKGTARMSRGGLRWPLRLSAAGLIPSSYSFVGLLPPYTLGCFGRWGHRAPSLRSAPNRPVKKCSGSGKCGLAPLARGIFVFPTHSAPCSGGRRFARPLHVAAARFARGGTMKRSSERCPRSFAASRSARPPRYRALASLAPEHWAAERYAMLRKSPPPHKVLNAPGKQKWATLLGRPPYALIPF